MIALDSVELTLPSAAGPVHILRGLDLIVERGETVSVVGPSGSGKSSLMMIIAGLERSNSGEASVGGHRITGLDEASLARIRRDSVGIVFLVFHLIHTRAPRVHFATPLVFPVR